MATLLEVDLGESGIVHAFRTPQGIMFSMSEVSSTLFNENPCTFGKELRQGRYNKQHTEDKNVLGTLAHLNVLPESSTSAGATLLSPQTLEELLNDKHKFDLVPILKIALMQMVTQESAVLMGQGKHEAALALALDAIKQGQKIFYPKAPLQLVPLYLLVVQVCLSLGRSTQCQELLGIASWLFLQSPECEENYEIQAEISRLFGQLFVLQNKLENALQAFAEEIYYISMKHGVLDIRTSIGFYNIFKVLKSLGRFEDCLAFGDVVLDTWLLMLAADRDPNNNNNRTFGDLDPKIIPNLESIELHDVLSMLQDILGVKEQVLGRSEGHGGGEIFLIIGLIYMYKKDFDRSLENLNKAKIAGSNTALLDDMIKSAIEQQQRQQKSF